MSSLAVYPCFPNAKRGVGTPLRTDTKRNLLIYALERTVVIREIVPTAGRPINGQLYTQHTCPVSAAAMAPSGCYMATGDVNGNVRVWACDNPGQILKLETVVFSGRVLDLAWSADSQRLVAVGEGSAPKVGGDESRAKHAALRAGTPHRPTLPGKRTTPRWRVRRGCPKARATGEGHRRGPRARARARRLRNPPPPPAAERTRLPR